MFSMMTSDPVVNDFSGAFMQASHAQVAFMRDGVRNGLAQQWSIRATPAYVVTKPESRLGYYTEVRFKGQELAKSVAENGVVVRDDNPDQLARCYLMVSGGLVLWPFYSTLRL